MRGFVARCRVGLRLARREARHRPWRTALVLLMLAIPTAGMAIGATLVRASEWTGADRRAAEFGVADALAEPRNNGPAPTDGAVAALVAGLPAGSRVVADRSYRERVRLTDRSAHFDVSDLPLEDPLTDGRFELLHGRYARADGEVVLTEDLARTLGLHVGDDLHASLAGGRLRIVGEVRSRAGPTQVAYVPLLEVAPRSVAAFIDLPGAARDHPPVAGWRITRPRVLNVSLATKTEWVLYTYLGGTVGFLVLGTVIAAAFAVGARRQLHTIGLLSSTGAAPASVRGFLVVQGLLGGLVGALTGVAAAMVALWLVPDHVLSEVVNRPVGFGVVRAADVVPIVVIATIAAVVAAWMPARSAARVTTLAALAGRPPSRPVPRWIPLLGVVTACAGCFMLGHGVAAIRHVQNDGGGPLVGSSMVLEAIAGLVAVVLGVLAIAPWIVGGLERISTRAPGALRLAGRSLGRSRARSSAVVGALCVVIAALIGSSTVYDSLPPEPAFDCFSANLASNLVAVESGATPLTAAEIERVQAILPGSTVASIARLEFADNEAGTPAGGRFVGPVDRDSTCMEEYQSGMGLDLATPALLDAFDVPRSLRRALAAGAAVTLASPPRDVTGVEIHTYTDLEDQPVARATTLPYGGYLDSHSAHWLLSAFLVSPETAERLDLVAAENVRYVIANATPLSAEQRQALTLLEDDRVWARRTDPSLPAIGLTLPEPDDPLVERARRPIGLALASVLVAAIVAVGLALAAKDSEAEAQVLSAVGASPHTLHLVGALRASLLVLVAGAVAVPAGLLPAYAIVTNWRVEAPHPLATATTFQPDLAAIALLVVGMPIAIGLLALAGAWLRTTVRPPRPLTFDFAE